jgi:hypothetical protein
MRQNGFFLRNLHEKLGTKMLWEQFFFWSKRGQKWTHAKIDYFSKNGQNRQFCVFFIGEKPKMMGI